jgi:hypothetical protein
MAVLLDEQILEISGACQRVRRWWKGSHPDKGVIIRGLTGLETVQDTYRIVPLHTFVVEQTGSPFRQF